MQSEDQTTVSKSGQMAKNVVGKIAALLLLLDNTIAFLLNIE